MYRAEFTARTEHGGIVEGVGNGHETKADAELFLSRLAGANPAWESFESNITWQEDRRDDLGVGYMGDDQVTPEQSRSTLDTFLGICMTALAIALLLAIVLLCAGPVAWYVHELYEQLRAGWQL